MSIYYVADGDRRRGPFTVEQFHQGIFRLLPDTLVWNRGMDEWTAAASVPELAGVLAMPSDVPPAFATSAPPAEGLVLHAVPHWVVIYTVFITPAVWVLQRLANLVMLIEGQNRSDFSGIVVVLLGWSLLTLVATALVVAGGAKLKLYPLRRPTLLWFGLVCSIVLAAIVFVFVIFGIGAASVQPPTQDGTPTSTFANLTFWTAAVGWVATQVANFVALKKLKSPRG